MLDRYGRNINYLRISLTDRCNLRCVYCMPEEGIHQIPRTEILDTDEIVRVCRAASELGISKIKLTGGEPLVRRICIPLVKELKALPGISQVTLTTNGILLAEQLPELMEAGLDAVNISLDTLAAETFERITRRSALPQVLQGLEKALSYPSLKVKVNCVPTFQPEADLIQIAELARENLLHVRFIEMMPIGLGKEFTARGEEQIKVVLERAYGSMTPTGERLGNGPCHYYTLENFQGRIGFISALSHKFCDSCNRVRLTSTGFLKGCLQFENGADLKALIRGGCSDETLKAAIEKVIYEKPAGHNFQEEKKGNEESHIMAQIGG
ncbi:GTP 3',8-cyclase MoaA [Blautia sp. Sow4_E7]|uniref:GTP 3',8-cyclase MoaA n=1 Tax=Blautia sp. Sow4_E7 TaxID=3438749 RepID=UPI003F9207CA